MYKKLCEAFDDVRRELHDVFSNIDDEYVMSLLHKLYQKQLALLTDMCPKVATMQELILIRDHFLEKLGASQIQKILNKYTETYSLFRNIKASPIATYILLTLYVLTRHPQELKKVILSYAAFVWINLFKKYIPYCKDDILVSALDYVDKRSLLYKYKGDFVKILEYLTEHEIQKVVKRFDVTSFSRLFSYIKHRINTILSQLAKAYYIAHEHQTSLAYKDEHETFSFSMLSIYIKQILAQISNASAIPEQVLTQFAKDMQSKYMLITFGKYFVQEIQESKELQDYFHSFLQFLLEHYPQFYAPKNICASLKSYQLLIKLLKDKRSQHAKIFKEYVDRMIFYVLNKHMPNKVELVKRYASLNAQFRKYLIRLLYFIYIKPAICR